MHYLKRALLVERDDFEAVVGSFQLPNGWQYALVFDLLGGSFYSDFGVEVFIDDFVAKLRSLK